MDRLRSAALVLLCQYGRVGTVTQIRASVKSDALWEFSYHTDSDKRRVEKVCEELEIDTGCVNTFKM